MNNTYQEVQELKAKRQVLFIIWGILATFSIIAIYILVNALIKLL